MNAKRHADLARALITACRGFEASAKVCRLNKTQLQKCCDAKSGRFLPIDVVHDLELTCGRRIYTDGLRHHADGQADLDDLVDETCELSEIVLAAQAFVREADDDDVLDQLEKKKLRRIAGRVRAQTADFLTVVDQVTA